MIEVWVAIVLTWNSPITRTVDKEFSSSQECWNYYENGVGESMFGIQNLTSQGNPPTKDFHFSRNGIAIRTYKGKIENTPIWLSCEQQ